VGRQARRHARRCWCCKLAGDKQRAREAREALDAGRGQSLRAPSPANTPTAPIPATQRPRCAWPSHARRLIIPPSSQWPSPSPSLPSPPPGPLHPLLLMPCVAVRIAHELESASSKHRSVSQPTPPAVPSQRSACVATGPASSLKGHACLTTGDARLALLKLVSPCASTSSRQNPRRARQAPSLELSAVETCFLPRLLPFSCPALGFTTRVPGAVKARASARLASEQRPAPNPAQAAKPVAPIQGQKVLSFPSTPEGRGRSRYFASMCTLFDYRNRCPRSPLLAPVRPWAASVESMTHYCCVTLTPTHLLARALLLSHFLPSLREPLIACHPRSDGKSSHVTVHKPPTQVLPAP